MASAALPEFREDPRKGSVMVGLEEHLMRLQGARFQGPPSATCTPGVRPQSLFCKVSDHPKLASAVGLLKKKVLKHLSASVFHF